jgi:hypothetical protein
MAEAMGNCAKSRVYLQNRWIPAFAGMTEWAEVLRRLRLLRMTHRAFLWGNNQIAARYARRFQMLLQKAKACVILRPGGPKDLAE